MAQWRHMPYLGLEDTGSSDGLLLDGTMPLPAPMLTYKKWSSAALTESQFHRKCWTWWCHQLKLFCVTGPLCGESPVTDEFPTQKPATRSFDVIRLNKRFSKKSWGWWFETPSRSLWRHCNGINLWKKFEKLIQSKALALKMASGMQKGPNP